MFDELIDRLQNRRTLILGIGNPLRGDDGLGPALIKRLQGKGGAVMIDAGDAPENHLFAIAKANPQAIVILDTARLGSQPGQVALVEVDDLVMSEATTHNAPLALFTKSLRSLTSADLFILAVEPEDLGIGTRLSPGVGETLDCLAQLFEQI